MCLPACLSVCLHVCLFVGLIVCLLVCLYSEREIHTYMSHTHTYHTYMSHIHVTHTCHIARHIDCLGDTFFTIQRSPAAEGGVEAGRSAEPGVSAARRYRAPKFIWRYTPTSIVWEIHFFFLQSSEAQRQRGGPPPAGRMTYWLCKAKAKNQ